MADAGWTKESVYDEQIDPLMKRIIAICKEHEIPLVAVFQFQDTVQGGPGYCTTMLPCPRESLAMRDLNQYVASRRVPVALAETITTNPDGSKMITIARVR